MDILEKIDYWSRNCGDRVAFIHREESLTYRQIGEQSDALAQWILDSFPNDSTPVVVYGHMQPEMIVSFLACVKAGHAYIPVDESIPLDRVDKIVKNSGTKLILSPTSLRLSSNDNAPKILDTSLNQSETLHSVIDAHMGQRPDSSFQVKGDANYYIIYTSGSTGEPKGVQITYNNLSSFIDWMMKDFTLSEHQVFLNQAPFSFDLSVMDVYPSLVSGGTLFALDKEMIAKPRELFDYISRSELNVWTSTPSFIEICLMDKGFRQEMLQDLHTFLFCGEILPKRTAELLLERFPGAVIYNTYGPTEATVAVTSIAIHAETLASYSSLPVGYCKSDCKIMIVDENKVPVPDGTKGEIVIVGPSVSPGYLNNPAITEKAFYELNDSDLGPTRAYKTGDSGYLENGLLFYGGRIDFQVKLHGYRIEIEDIEHHLRSLPMIKAAVILPVYKDDKCEYLTAFVVAEDGVPADEFKQATDIKSELTKSIPSYMVPRKIIFRDHIPMTNNGKVNRKELLAEVHA